MPDETPPNVKIYDRPERKGPSPLIIALFVLIALAGAFFTYRALQPAAAPAPAAGAAQTSRFPATSAYAPHRTVFVSSIGHSFSAGNVRTQG
jgi:hypothetical protein